MFILTEENIRSRVNKNVGEDKENRIHSHAYRNLRHAFDWSLIHRFDGCLEKLDISGKDLHLLMPPLTLLRGLQADEETVFFVFAAIAEHTRGFVEELPQTLDPG